MSTLNTHRQRTSNCDLTKFIEPLANYICATDRPHEVLVSALAVLHDEIGATNRAARLHVSRVGTARTDCAR